jgi:hypothetical protein
VPPGHLPDRSETEDRETPAAGDTGVDNRLPGSRQYVGKVDESVIDRTVRYLDRSEVCLWNADELRLATRHASVQLGVAEEGRALAVLSDLGSFALAVKLPVAHEAMSARDVERNDYPVARFDVADLAANGFNNSDRFVPENGSFFHECVAKYFVYMKIGPTNAR